MPRIICQFDELNLFEEHLIRLNFSDRQTRFQGYLSDEAIRSYIRTIQNKDNHVVIGKFCNNNMQLIAGAHISIYNKIAELAFSVESEYRKKGYSKLLFYKCLDIAKEHECVAIHTDCFRHNIPMMMLAKSFGLSITKDGADAFGDAFISNIAA